MATSCLQILVVDDNPDDAELLCVELSTTPWAETSFECTCVSTLASGLRRLSESTFDVAILDLGLPDSERLGGLVKIRALHPTLPVVVVTGLEDKSVGVEAVQAGAQDYLVKGYLSGQILARVMIHSIKRREMECERESLIEDLQAAVERIRMLSRLLPICAGCKMIRTDQGNWQQIEGFIWEHTEATFTHSVCPDCHVRFYPELTSLDPIL